MTTGHKHRTIRVRDGSALLHLLQTPLAHTTDRDRAQRSRFTWGQQPTERYRNRAGSVVVQRGGPYILTPLGVLHALTGLTIDTTPRA